MKCPECGSGMKGGKGTYRYVESGLDNVLLVGITVYTCPERHQMPEIPQAVELHQIIAALVLCKKGTLSGREVRFLRKHLGMSGQEFASRIGVTNVTLSDWEHGKQNISPASDRAIRFFVAFKFGGQVLKGTAVKKKSGVFTSWFRNFDLVASRPPVSQKVAASIKIDKGLLHRWNQERFGALTHLKS